MKRYSIGFFGREKEDENGDWVKHEAAESEIKCRDRRIIMMLESNDRYRRLKKVCTGNMAKLIDEYHRSEQEAKLLKDRLEILEKEKMAQKEENTDLKRIVKAFVIANTGFVLTVLISVSLL